MSAFKNLNPAIATLIYNRKSNYLTSFLFAISADMKNFNDKNNIGTYYAAYVPIKNRTFTEGMDVSFLLSIIYYGNTSQLVAQQVS